MRFKKPLPAAFILSLGLASTSLLLAQEKIPLRVRMGDVSVNKVPFLIAMDQNLYAKHGLDVDLVPFSASSARVNSVEGYQKYIRDNNPQITVGGGSPLIFDKANSVTPSDRVILASTDHIVRWHVVAREGITKVEDLKGKRIAYSGEGACSHYIAMLLADRMGWDPKFDLALLGGDYSATPLKNGWADALFAYEVPLAQLRVAGFKPVVDLRPWNEPIPCSGVNASREWAHQNRDTVNRFLKALTEAIALMKQDKYTAFQAMEKWYRFTDREVQQIIYDGAAEMPRKPYPAIDGIKKTMELYDSAQMRRFKPEDFYDDSFMKELDQSGFIDGLYSTQPSR